jgi:hypothetical protein
LRANKRGNVVVWGAATTKDAATTALNVTMVENFILKLLIDEIKTRLLLGVGKARVF